MPSTIVSKTPFDDGLHPWWVHVAWEEPTTPPLEVFEEALTAILFARVRPDRADAALSALLAATVADAANASDVVEVLRVCVVEGAQGPDSWPKLAALVEERHHSHGELLAPLRRALRFAGRLSEPQSGTERSLSRESIDETDAGELFNRAKATLAAARKAPSEREARSLKAEALRDLTTARELWVGTQHEVEATISLGNAHRLRPDADLDQAIALYELAEQAADGDAKGRLHKVWSDALRERGGDDDLRSAWEQVQLALKYRKSGWLRAEALWSAALVAQKHPDWAEGVVVPRATRLFAEAAECDARVTEQWMGPILGLVARWAAMDATSRQLAEVIEQLKSAYPSRSNEITRAGRGSATGPFGLPMQSPESVSDVAALLGDPNARVFIDAELAQQDPSALEATLERMSGPLAATRGPKRPPGLSTGAGSVGARPSRRRAVRDGRTRAGSRN